MTQIKEKRKILQKLDDLIDADKILKENLYKTVHLWTTTSTPISNSTLSWLFGILDIDFSLHQTK